MGILLVIAAILIALYTVSSVVGLWLSSKIMNAVAVGDAMPAGLEEAPAHHIDLMSNYGLGWRRNAWVAAIVALFTTLIAMLANSPLAFWALGIAILIDLVLFLTYKDIKGFLAQTTLQERLIDAAQSLALLGVLGLLLWVHLRAGEIIN
jgi:hypothetical protein